MNKEEVARATAESGRVYVMYADGEVREERGGTSYEYCTLEPEVTMDVTYEIWTQESEGVYRYAEGPFESLQQAVDFGEAEVGVPYNIYKVMRQRVPAEEW